MDERNDFMSNLEIDPTQLDVECGMQGELFFKWAEKSTEARALVDTEKFRAEVLLMQLAGQARSDPGSFGLVKVTEAAVQEAVKTHPDYIEAYERYLEARAASGILEKAVEAMEQRKRMLESLISLHGMQYFAGPSVPRDLVAAWNERKADREEKVVKKTKLRKRKNSA